MRSMCVLARKELHDEQRQKQRLERQHANLGPSTIFSLTFFFIAAL